MPKPATSCLYNDWRRLSAPIFHTSEFWPSFNEAQIKAFLESNDPNPIPSRPLNYEAAQAAKEHIEAFVQHAEAVSETDYPCKSAYIAFEAERLTILELILNAETASSEQISAYNDPLFGNLEELHHDEMLGYLKHQLQELQPKTREVDSHRQTLLTFWQHQAADTTVSQTFNHLARYRDQFRPLVSDRYSFMEELIKPYAAQSFVEAKAVSKILQAALGRLTPAELGWKAVLRDGAPNIFVHSDERSIILPAGRSYTHEHIRNLIVHEIGVHVLRNINGGSSRERLAGSGMPGYAPIEEAFGVLVASVYKTKLTADHPLQGMGIISIAQRLDNSSFRDIYELLRALIVCQANPDETTMTSNVEQYNRRAFGYCLRVLRLGTGKLIERSVTKYWWGMLMLEQYLATAGATQTTYDEFLAGKYNCLEPQQLNLIRYHSRVAPQTH